MIKSMNNSLAQTSHTGKGLYGLMSGPTKVLIAAASANEVKVYPYRNGFPCYLNRWVVGQLEVYFAIFITSRQKAAIEVVL